MVFIMFLVLLHTSIATDQIIRRTVVVEIGLCLVLELWNDAFRQHLAELHTPLVKGINVPNDSLSEDGVLIKGNELAQDFRREPISQNRVRWPVTVEDSV